MRMRLLATLLAWSLIGWSGYASAQDDDEEEEGEDVDALMQSDPEREEEEEEGEEEAPEGDDEKPPSYGEQQGDEERPPGEEPVATEKKEEPAPEPDSGPVNKVSLGVLVGYGISFKDANPWGFGLGVRGGYNFGGFHLGLRLAYFLGSDYEAPRFDTSQNQYFVTESWSLFEIGPEAGWDIFVGSWDIRPYLGVGLALVTRDEEMTLRDPASSTSTGDPFIAPGVSAMYLISDSFFLGLDVRVQFVFRTVGSFTGLPLNAYIGMRF